MAQTAKNLPVYLEISSKKTFAGALEWPGWARSGRDPEAALAALRDYAPRYAQVLRAAGIDFPEITEDTEFDVVERLEGNATTDFGAPAIPPSRDADPLTASEVDHLSKILNACWRAFDEAVAAAQGKTLRKGPRGGGRELDRIIEHVMGAEHGYLTSVGGEKVRTDGMDTQEEMAALRRAALAALEASAAGQIPATGPRGGERWTARYFARRLAWHTLDHAWEIGDRITSE